MAAARKLRSVFVCQSCGAQSSKWLGRCPSCNEWNSLVEESAARDGGKAQALRHSAGPTALGDVPFLEHARISCGDPEFDRVLGGGLVPGAAILLGGEPGIGKSTLLLQVLAHLSKTAEAMPVLYVSGEESAQQIAMRARRLQDYPTDAVQVLPSVGLAQVEQVIAGLKPRVVVIDSVQTLRAETLESAPGTVAQLREVSSRLIDIAKRESIALFLVGHVTKEGALAGPKVLEHLVDTVLTFEGDWQRNVRLVRATKNRFGAVHEVGIFEMRESGLCGVDDPSALFLQQRSQQAPGAIIVPSMQGSRPLLVEIQALVAPAVYGAARRVVSELDSSRLAILLAVLDKKAGVHVLDQDVFASVAGGVRVDERAIDLALAVAVVSSLRNRAVAADMAVVGEVGLTGELRAVGHVEARLHELAKRGFRDVVVPQSNAKQLDALGDSLELNVHAASSLGEALVHVFDQ